MASDMSGAGDPRPHGPDTVEEWRSVAIREDVGVMLEADDQAVFVTRVESDEFNRGHTWISNAIDPESGARTNSHTHPDLVRRWFVEAVPKGRAWEFPTDRTPLKEDRHVE